MYQLSNIPSKKSRLLVESRANGEDVEIFAYDKEGKAGHRDLLMQSVMIGDHLLEKPYLLRELIGTLLVHAITQARDAGYAQAQADILEALGASKS